MPRSRLVTSDPSTPGITRVRRGRGFSYVGPDGEPVRDDATLARIGALVIPPAWDDVWISPDERGHLQAIGVDAEGRRQYRYHDEFTARRAAAKWQRVEAFGRVLGDLRREVREATADPALAGRDQAAAVAWCVRMLDRSMLRVGIVEYERRNGTYGLCTLRRKHVDVDGGVTTLRFVGKHGKSHTVTIVDELLAEALEVVLEGRGREAPFLGWRDGRSWRPITSAQVNAWVSSRAAGSTAKDFRSWHGSVLAAAGLVFEQRLHPDLARAAIVPRVIAQVATVLGNTPAVTRSAYVHPAVLDNWLDGRDIGPAIDVLESFDDISRADMRDVAEHALLDLLDGRTPRTMRDHARAEVAA
jgi:DNA topoisomerase IB